MVRSSRTVSSLIFLLVLLRPHAFAQHLERKLDTAGNQAQLTSSPCEELRRRDSPFLPLAETCQFALALPKTLPDLICTETMKRYLGEKSKADVVAAELTVKDMQSHYANVTVNGRLELEKSRSGDEIFSDQAGSTGEFALLFNLFAGVSHTDFSAPVVSMVNGRKALRYDFRVQRKNNVSWTWFFVGTAINPGYHGSIFLDARTGTVFRLFLEVNSDEVDPETPISQSRTTIDYSDVKIGSAGVHHVPIRSENISCFRALIGCMRESVVFEGFHKFAAKARILQ